MRALPVVLLLAALGCHSSGGPSPTRPQLEPVFIPASEWQTATTEPYKGKQDDIYFATPQIGFYGNGAGKLFRTTDSGATWTKILDQPGTFWRAVGFVDEKRGFAGNIGPDYYPGVTDAQMLYRTDDGGATWTKVALPDIDGARGVCAIDVLTLDYVNAGHRGRREIVHVGGRVGGPASLFGSDDGGITWRRIKLPPAVAMILDVKFLDPSTGFVFAGSDVDVARSHGLILKTTDAGATWRTVYTSARAFELVWKGAFPSRQVGYATLQNYSAEADADDKSSAVPPVTARFVVKTTDGGESWRELPMVDNGKVQELGVGFIDEERGWVGAIPTGFQTTDGGATWTPAPGMPRATNKIRIVPDATGATVWAIGVDVRHLQLKAR